MMKTIHQSSFPRSLSTDSCSPIHTDSVLTKTVHKCSVPRSVSTDSYSRIHTGPIKHSISYDEVDNPDLRKLFNHSFTTEDELLRAMKYERNRLYSFQGKWPMRGIKPESLSEAGLFYLQEEDRVQCPFCTVVLYHWTEIDKPLREHMKKSPRCPFLMGSHDCGNVPLLKQQKSPKHSKVTSQAASVEVQYKPKHPGMADVKNRLLSFPGWPKLNPDPQALAECGLYYTGVADVVTCFFCNGSLGNWESGDDPWEEHSKFYSDCAFLSLAASRNMRPQKVDKSCNGQSSTLIQKPLVNGIKQRGPDITTDIVSEALHIFPEPVVRNAVERIGGNVTSLEELCDDILCSSTSEKKKDSTEVPSSSCTQVSSSSGTEKGPSHTSDALLCKICMDREREVVFQPCGHLVACFKCSQRLGDCPVCRRPIQHVIRTYVI